MRWNVKRNMCRPPMVRMPRRFSASVALLFLLTTSLLQAQVVPGRWEKVDALAPGKQIIITLKSGESTEGEFRGSAHDKVSLVTQTGRALTVRDLPKFEVARIVSRQADSLQNGLWIGLAIGAAPGLVSVARNPHGEDMPEVGLFVAIFGAGIGVAIGLLADLAHKGREEVLYQAP